MIATDRLRLRRWEDRDRAPFHAMGRDVEVMRYLGPLLSRPESDAAIDRQNALIDTHGHAFWAIERRDDGTFLGFCGVKPGPPGTPIENELEIGWRIASPQWRRGFAIEAARATLAWVWANRDVPTVAAITVPANVASWRLMERLGMTRAGAFDHPVLPIGDPLRRHLLYRIARPSGAAPKLTPAGSSPARS